MQILAIDPGIDNLGVALLVFDQNNFNIIKVEHCKFNRTKLIELVEKSKPNEILIEQQSQYSKIKTEMFYLMGYFHARGYSCKMVQPIAKTYSTGKTTYKQRKELSVEKAFVLTKSVFDPNVSDAINIVIREYLRLHPEYTNNLNFQILESH